MADTLTVLDADGRELAVALEPEETLAAAVFADARIAPRPLCSGLGHCGRCRVRFLSAAPEPEAAETQRLGPELTAKGWRLACRHTAGPGMRVELPPAPLAPKPVIDAAAAQAESLALAVDLGTTSLHWQAMSNGRAVARGQELNPQLGAGSEVMSRLESAGRRGTAPLAQLVANRLRAIIEALPADVSEICVAGNPAMLHILFGLDITGLSRAPYSLAWTGGERELAPDLPPAYAPPLVSPFVGADATAGLAQLMWGEGAAPEYPLLLADMGTNGEFLLALSQDEWLGASVALGPALEGVGLTFGGLAEPGAVSGFELTPGGLGATFIGEDSGAAEPSGTITGTGYLSLVHALFRAGLLREDGRFGQASLAPLAARFLPRISRDKGEVRFDLQIAAPGQESLYLTGADVEALLKVKAAFNAAWSRLLAEAGLRAGDLRSVRLAGAMGEHVRLRDLEGLGFLPQGLGMAVRKAGNTALAGAGLLLARPELREPLAKAAAKCRVLDLANEPGFGQAFVERMVFAHVP